MTAKTRRCSSPPNKMHPKGTSVPYPTPSKSFGGGILSVRGGVGDKDYIFLNTKGICLLCYDECDPVTNDEKRRVHTQTTINFCRLISRYLNFSMENVIANSLKTVGRRGVEDKKKFDNVAFELCERCVGLAHAFNQVHFQVQFHQMILDRCVRSISDIIKKANKKSVNELFVLSEDEEAMKNQKKTFTRLTMGGFQSANRLRTKLYTRSMTKLSSSFPIIKLKRICKSGDWIKHLKKGKKEEKSKMVPASPPVVRYSVNSREVHLLASYLGCIVSFWLVISMSFINLDELVINIKKEKLIELKLERDIGVDVDSGPFRPQTKRSPMKIVEETPKKKRNYKKKAQIDEGTNEEAKQEPKKRGRKRKVEVMPNNEMKTEVASSACSVKNPPQNVHQPNHHQNESPKKAFVMSKSPTGVTILTKTMPKTETEFPSCNNTNHLQALEKVQVPAATTASALPTWQPVKPVPVQATPQPYLAPIPPTQFPGQYAPPQQPSQSLQSIQPTASSSSTYQYNYPSTSTQPQPTYIPQSQQYYSSTPAVPSSSSNYQQPSSYQAQAYQAPVAPAPAPITQQRRSSAASTTYDCFAYNNSETTPSSYNNYNYNQAYNNYSDANNTGTGNESWNFGDQQNSSVAFQSTSSTYMYSSTPQTYTNNDYGYASGNQESQNSTIPAPTDTVPVSSSTNNGLYSYTGYDNNYVAQDNYSYSGTPSTAPTANSLNNPAYYGMMPPLSVPPPAPTQPHVSPEPVPSLTYEEPPLQLHDLEVEEHYFQTEANTAIDRDDDDDLDGCGGASGGGAKPQKSLSIFPEVHWRQQSTEKKIPCTHSNCKEQFITSAQLQLHLRAHGTFKCRFCNISFGKAHSVALHEKMKHPQSGGGTRGKCPRCDYNITSSSYKYLLHFLNDHMNISVHDDPCEVCNKPFILGTKSVNRKNHFRKYHDVLGKDPGTIRTCMKCNAPFLKETQLKDHHGHCSNSSESIGRASSVASTVSTTVEEITYNTAVATAGQVIA